MMNLYDISLLAMAASLELIVFRSFPSFSLKGLKSRLPTYGQGRGKARQNSASKPSPNDFKVPQQQWTHHSYSPAEALEDLDMSAPKSRKHPPNGWTFETSSRTWRI